MHAFRTYIFAKAYTRCIAVWLRQLHLLVGTVLAIVVGLFGQRNLGPH